jgi:hypothetical protein
MTKTQDVKTAVEDELIFDPLIDATGITVANLGGEVSLRGDVSSYPENAEAAAAARRVVVGEEVDGRFVGDFAVAGEELGGECDVGLGGGQLSRVAEAEYGARSAGSTALVLSTVHRALDSADRGEIARPELTSIVASTRRNAGSRRGSVMSTRRIRSVTHDDDDMILHSKPSPSPKELTPSSSRPSCSIWARTPYSAD